MFYTYVRLLTSNKINFSRLKDGVHFTRNSNIFFTPRHPLERIIRIYLLKLFSGLHDKKKAWGEGEFIEIQELKGDENVKQVMLPPFG